MRCFCFFYHVWQLIEYNDSSDVADLNQISPNDTSLWQIHDLHDALWDNSTMTSDPSSHLINFTITTNNSLSLQDNGSFSITVSKEFSC